MLSFITTPQGEINQRKAFFMLAVRGRPGHRPQLHSIGKAKRVKTG